MTIERISDRHLYLPTPAQPEDGAGEIHIFGLSLPRFLVLDQVLRQAGVDLECLHGPDSALAELHWRAPVTHYSDDPDWQDAAERLFDEVDQVSEAISQTGLKSSVQIPETTGPYMQIFDAESEEMVYTRLSRQRLIDLANPDNRLRYVGGEDSLERLGIMLGFRDNVKPVQEPPLRRPRRWPRNFGYQRRRPKSPGKPRKEIEQPVISYEID